MSEEDRLPAEASEVERDPTKAEETVDWDNPATWPREIGGAKGPEPTRYGDWERNGRCSDF